MHERPELSCVEQRLASLQRRLPCRRASERLAGDRQAQCEQASKDPVSPQRRHELQAVLLRQVRLARPRVSGKQVLAFEIEPFQPFQLLGSDEPGACPAREIEVERQVARSLRMAMPIGLGLLTLQYAVDIACLATGRAPPFDIAVEAEA